METHVLRKIRDGSTTIGVWANSGSPLIAEIVARTHPDWMMLDAQHGAVTEAGLLPLFMAIGAGGSVPFVRVRSDDPSLIMRALDLGAAGVVVPMVSTPAQARAVVAAVRYPPRGSRSYGPLHGYQAAGDVPGESFEPLCLVMIETAEGVDRVDEILDVEGIDGVFIGPADLSLGLGFGHMTSDSLGAARPMVRTIFEAARSRGLVAGAASFSPTMTAQLLELGARFIAGGSDLGYVRAGARADALRRVELIAAHEG